jgi:nitroimidazol reductase NimA-like FMN-containing flavoprotein (pyridoxamine 5'-phosphate oxidase superfamily)
MPSRRDLIVMTDDEVRAYLRNSHRLILVTNGRGGYPHPVPMNFIFNDQEQILMTTFRKSQKVRNLQRDPKAALLLESGIAYGELMSVLAYAEAEIIDDSNQVIDLMNLLTAKEAALTGSHTGVVKTQAESTASKRVVLRFTPDSYISWDHTKLKGLY